MATQGAGGISWTEVTWNPIRGCRRVSDECRRCYAEIVAGRFSQAGQPYHGLAVMTPDGARWTGEIRVAEDHLYDPLRWQRPRLIFTNSMSDLFYEDLPIGDIDRIVLVMMLAKRHTFQVLTKRYQRMADYLTDDQLIYRLGALFESEEFEPIVKGKGWWWRWPLPNVWWGFSAGRQKTFDEAMPHIMRMDRDATIRWWSAEPLLEAIDCSPVERRGTNVHLDYWLQHLNWVVAGGESQTGCRPMDLAWPRAIKARCDGRTDMGRPWALPFYMKQLGGSHNPRKALTDFPPDLRIRDYPRTAAV